MTVDEESGDLKLKEFKTESVDPAYMDILRWRADQKYGRRGPKRKSQAPAGLNTNVNGVNGRSSPYNSPTVGAEDRGRSTHRFSRGPNGSPRGTVGSPLARVQEEGAQGGDVVKDFALDDHRTYSKPDKLVDAPTPVETRPTKNKLVDIPTPPSARYERKEFPQSSLSRSTTQMSEDEEDKENRNKATVQGLGVNGIEDEMKNVAIE